MGMFSFPVTVPVRTPESIYPMDVHVDIDKIALVKPLLDNNHSSGVESDPLYSLIPNSEIIFEDGRRLPVLETVATITAYLDAYRTLDHFFNEPPIERQDETKRGEVIPLFKDRSCVSSEASTPA